MRKSATERMKDSTSKSFGNELAKREMTIGSAERGNQIGERLLLVNLQCQFRN